MIIPWGVNAQSNYFKIAEARVQKFGISNKNFAIIIDYTKNILQERLYILDLKNPTMYSNKRGSAMSSKGTFVTGEKIVSPKFGYSMLVKGLEIGVNNNARVREIIFHSDARMKTKWSNGCFATPEKINNKIIDLTNNGTIVCVIDN
jgi:hypothetical protein